MNPANKSAFEYAGNKAISKVCLSSPLCCAWEIDFVCAVLNEIDIDCVLLVRQILIVHLLIFHAHTYAAWYVCMYACGYSVVIIMFAPVVSQ